MILLISILGLILFLGLLWLGVEYQRLVNRLHNVQQSHIEDLELHNDILRETSREKAELRRQLNTTKRELTQAHQHLSMVLAFDEVKYPGGFNQIKTEINRAGVYYVFNKSPQTAI